MRAHGVQDRELREVRRRLDWLKRQVFGQKSERRRIEGDAGITDRFARDEAPHSPRGLEL